MLSDKQKDNAARVQKEEDLKRDKDYIQLNDIEKIRALDPHDRYNVLEYLIRELIQLKTLHPDEKSGKKKRRKSDYSSSDEEPENKTKYASKKSTMK